MERPIIAAYWEVQEADSKTCAKDILGVLENLKELQLCSGWVYKGIKRTDPKAQVILEEDQIEKHLRQNKTEIGKQIIPELGFSFSCWSGDNNNQCDFSAHLGSYSSHVGNNVLLELHEVESINETEIKLYLQVLRNMISRFDPTTAIITSHRIFEGSKTKKDFCDFGYVVYTRKRGKLETHEIPQSWVS